MYIEHIAIWTDDLDRLVQFYTAYFGATVAPRYANPARGFESQFISFSGGARLEVMKTTMLSTEPFSPGAQRMGLTHFAISVGSEQLVEQITRRIEGDGHPVLDGPRRTGDGYYESVVLDPDGNRVEITA
jgi:lactoylglutathione lyase